MIFFVIVVGLFPHKTKQQTRNEQTNNSSSEEEEEEKDDAKMMKKSRYGKMNCNSEWRINHHQYQQQKQDDY